MIDLKIESKIYEKQFPYNHRIHARTWQWSPRKRKCTNYVLIPNSFLYLHAYTNPTRATSVSHINKTNKHHLYLATNSWYYNIGGWFYIAGTHISIKNNEIREIYNSRAQRIQDIWRKILWFVLNRCTLATLEVNQM